MNAPKKNESAGRLQDEFEPGGNGKNSDRKPFYTLEILLISFPTGF